MGSEIAIALEDLENDLRARHGIECGGPWGRRHNNSVSQQLCFQAIGRWNTRKSRTHGI